MVTNVTTATAKKNARSLIESMELEEAFSGMTIDDANGVLKGVVLLTGNKLSPNKTFYTDKALAEATTRYQNANMYIDHKRDERGNPSVKDFGGVYKDVRLDGDKVRADLHLVESARSMVTAIAKMKPASIGLSIRDRGHGVEKDGVFLVEGFDPKTKYSIDLVANPSTNKTLFESENNNHEEEDMDFKLLTLETLNKERPDLIESVQNAGKAAILKELDEAKAKGQKSDAMAAKLHALIEADFSKDVSEAVRKMIIPDDISLETAKGIITGQKALIESVMKSKAAGTKPIVKDMGQKHEEHVEESEKSEITDDDFVAAFSRR